MRLIDADALLEMVDKERQYLIARGQNGAEHILVHNFRDLIDKVPIVKPRIEYGIDGQAYRLFISSPTEVVKVGEPLSNSDEISKALEKGDIYKRGFESGYLKGKEERLQGKWIDTGDKQEYWSEEYQCSLCGAKDHWHNFCPNCGAKMYKEVN